MTSNAYGDTKEKRAAVSQSIRSKTALESVMKYVKISDIFFKR